MRFLIGLAWRNLSRYRKRTFITASAIAIGLAVFLWTDSFLLGAEVDSERNLIWYESSSARVMHPDYWEERTGLPLKYTIEDPKLVLSAMERQSIPAAPRVVFGADLIVREDPYPEDGSIRVKVHALDPARDDEVFRFRETVTAGRYLEPGEDGVLLGAWLAEDLGAEVGYPLTLVTRTRDGYYQTIDTEVVGIINCPNPFINRSSVFIPLDTADYYLEMNGAVTEIDIRLPLRVDADQRAGEIQESLPRLGEDLKVMSWRELAFDYVALAESKQAGSGMIMFLVFIIAAVGVSNTMLMAVYERTKELGTMRALGMKDSQIRWAFLLEAGGIGFIGSVLGLALGSILVFWITRWGIDYSAVIRQADIGYRVAAVFRGAWHPAAMVQAFVLGIVIAMVVALIPTRRALKMRITDCLRAD